MYYISLLLILIAFIFSVIVLKKTSWKGYCIFDSFYIGANVYLIGILMVSFVDDSPDAEFILNISVIFYCATFISWAFNRIAYKKMFNVNVIKKIHSSNKLFLVLSVVFLLLVNAAFSYLVYTRIIQGQSLLKLLDIRKMISSGEAGYLFPGGVKQIRDIYGIAFMFWMNTFYTGRWRGYVISVTTIILLSSMILSGQRTAILVLMLSLGLSSYIKGKLANKKTALKTKLLMVGVFVGLLYLVTILLGRTDPDDGFLESFGKFIWSMAYRVFATVPMENVHIMPFLRQFDPEPFSLWLADLSILLPGKQESMSNAMHAYLGGSEQGNSVLGTPLDIFMNSGYVGLVFVPLIVLFFSNMLQAGLINQRNPFSIAILVVLFFYMPFCYSFYMLLLNGGLFAILYMAYSYMAPRKITDAKRDF